MLGVDLALRSTGLSIYAPSGVHQRCITIEKVLSRGSKKDPPIPEVERIRRCLQIANEIIKTMEVFKVRHVGIEGYAHGAKFQNHQLGEVHGIVKSQIWLKYRIVPKVVPPKSARKHVFGFGGSIDKKGIVRVVEEGLGVAVENDHEADATVVARWTFDTAVAEEKEAMIDV